MARYFTWTSFTVYYLKYLVVRWLGVGLPAGALSTSSQPGQLSLPSLRGR